MRKGGSAGVGLDSGGSRPGTMGVGARARATGAGLVAATAAAGTFGRGTDGIADGAAALVVSEGLIGADGDDEAGRAATKSGGGSRRLTVEGRRSRVVFARPGERGVEARLGLVFRAVFGLVLRVAVVLRAGRLAAGGDGFERLALFPGLTARGFFDFMPAKFPS